MTVLGCAAVRKRLAAFHDGELPVAEQVAVAAHLDGCTTCVAEARTLERIGALVREGAVARVEAAPGVAHLREVVVARFRAEDAQSWSSQVGHLFEDMHLVWAALSASFATAVCAVLLFGIWYFSPPERADSLAGVLDALATPGSNRNPVRPDDRLSLPRVALDASMPALFSDPDEDAEDVVFALNAIVTQEGRVAFPELVASSRNDRATVVRVMNAVHSARFQPASYRDGSPVAVNLVWLLTHTTVRAKTHG
jgi:hypothetical protein